MTKLKDAIKDAVQAHDCVKVAKISDYLRFKHGIKYNDQYKIFHDLTGISLPGFDALLYEADRMGV